MLHRALSERCDLQTLSFSRQYPKWLFPGESDRDPDYQGHLEPGVEYLIDSLDPRTWAAAVRRVMAHDSQVVILPWWTVYWTFCFRFIVTRLRRKGVRVLFFCHNVIEHESAAWKRLLTKSVLGQGSRFVVHTRVDRDNLVREIPDADIGVHPHPIYSQFPSPDGELPRRARLELLFYGFVRPYKGLDVLIDALSRLDGLDYALTIAGEFWKGEDETRARIEELGLSDRIKLRPRYHSDQETAQLFSRADFVVLPYRSATGSGVIPIAYHYDTPVIATKVGGLPDVVDQGATGFLVEADSAEQLAGAIRAAADFMPDPESFASVRKRMSWGSLADLLLASESQSKCH